LVLIAEHGCHGYELAERLQELGFQGPRSSNVYKLLRTLEREGLTTSAWDLSRDGGPTRRIYSLTPSGEDYIRSYHRCILTHRDALSAVLDRWAVVEKQRARRQ
jgi:poly-beta-hydroxybutyrate-responsive repressor